MFIDEVKIVVKAGDGGDGCISFRREKYVPKGGPNGGDGGKGGDVILVTDPQLTTLLDFKYQPHIKGERGEHGKGKDMYGRGGKDARVNVPVGTQVYDAATGECLADLTEAGEEMVVAQGGKGGYGNIHFKSSTRQAPRIAEKGEPGEERTLRLVLKLIADVGLIGLPNAGKSTLLSRISAAHPKIADYPFTTLTPNLGVVQVDIAHHFVVADIPGLIEGAHTGLGLGDRFLRHIERTRLLVHLVDVSASDPVHDFQTVTKELAQYEIDLSTRPQIIVLTKMDLSPPPEQVKSIVSTFQKMGCSVLPISAVSGEGIDPLIYEIAKELAHLSHLNKVEDNIDL